MSTQHTKLMHQHSFDTVTMNSGRRASRSSETTFSCSQQSILSAMERFVKSVNTMDSTVLVPIKLRDMDVQALKNGTSKIKLPSIMQNDDLYSFYLLLHDVKKELLWGPSTAQSTIAICSPLTSFNAQHNHGTSNLNVSLNSASNSLASPLSYGSSGSSASGSTSNGSVGNSNFNNRIVPLGAVNKKCDSTASLVSMDTTPTQSVIQQAPSASPLNGTVIATSNSIRKRENTHSRQPSDDSLGSFGSGTSALDLDSESEGDSLLHDHTLHLAASFKHHLEGLHTILHQLSDAANFFCTVYQQEIDKTNSH